MSAPGYPAQPSYGAYDQPQPGFQAFPAQQPYYPPAQPGFPAQPAYPAQPPYQPGFPAVTAQPGYYPQPPTQTIVVQEKESSGDGCKNCLLCALCTTLCCWCCVD